MRKTATGWVLAMKSACEELRMHPGRGCGEARSVVEAFDITLEPNYKYAKRSSYDGA
jgi:hypothetical protein